MTEKLEVFQDMTIRGPTPNKPALRAALVAAAVDPWSIDLERSAAVARDAVTSDDVVLFRRDADQDHPGAGLTLWGTQDGYYVPNIIPLEMGSLSFTQYNAVLMDFITRIAAPVATKFGFTISTTEPLQTIDDWLTPDAALKLRRFSGAANKSSGASHPMDQRRWFDFLVAAHRGGNSPGPDRLARWLHEAEGWDEDSAHNLAGDFESSMALLAYYQEH
ncbi:hypothetical protein [Asticcacaulis endophyticus]|uniref:Uncharacterized protein n=1 Tax=Asticcacaulis endophyticus TaxID=1395890 RepID=A0A918UU04_9CAUL|nr:hypothetical protein [Asticcacaulis endophyticus]GGZ32879.1 hypothetical protein GCM10011273_18950 [Asticcacaulis endophyticus]